MHYVIQENTFRERHYDKLEESLNRLGLTYDIVRCYPYGAKVALLSDVPDSSDGAYDLEDVPDYDPGRKDVFCFGAIALARVAKEKGWNPGSMLNDNHNYMVYKDYWKDNLLNYDSKIHKLMDEFEWDSELKFIRPTEDTKVFTGDVFDKEKWETKRDEWLHNYRNERFNDDTLVQVSTPKNISKEIRFWVVGGKVVSGSTYRVMNSFNINGQVFPDEYEFAQSMVDIFQLNEAFVIDICVTDKGYKIVEAGCINSAGFYNVDLMKAIIALEDHFGNNFPDPNSVIDYPPGN
jgi:hypothetical protein